MIQHVQRRRIEAGLVAVFAFVLAAAFAQKAFHIDDPLNLWTAQAIVASPSDFLGFDVNWKGRVEPIYFANLNPPGNSFLLAAVGSIFGWGEVPMHLVVAACLSLLSVGVYFLAERFRVPPLWTALAFTSFPAVLLSATTIMTDIPMLMAYTWGVYWWMRGIDEERARYLALGALAIGCSALTKYFGLTALPLLVLYAVGKKRAPSFWSPFLLIPLAMLFAFQVWAHWQYGVNPLAYAMRANAQLNDLGLFDFIRPRGLVGLAFSGGCLVTVLAIAPLCLPRRHGALLLVVFGVLFTIVARNFDMFFYRMDEAEGGGTWLVLHYALFMTAGIEIFVLAIVYLRRTRDAAALVLVCWLLGTWVYASYINWSVTARTMLPMSVPAALLLGWCAGLIPSRRRARLVPALALAYAVALAVAYGDFYQANTAKWATQEFLGAQKDFEGNYWFAGHWGFQYYMQEAGVSHFSSHETASPSPGDRIAVPMWNFQDVELDTRVMAPAPEAAIRFSNPTWVSTMARERGAGFYTSAYGPLPFSFGPAPDVDYEVYEFLAAK